MDELEHLKQSILTEYPRLLKEDRISFMCGPQLVCFNHCCADVNIFLTPYDVLRLRRTLKIGATDFLARHTIVPFDKNQRLPIPLLKMNDTERKECPFVDEKAGCTVYNDRPWPCRMYPLGVASPGGKQTRESEEFFFLLQDDFCLGLKSERNLTITEWLEEQETAPYEAFGELYKELTLDEALAQGAVLSPMQIDMYWKALYDLDGFRAFVFQSSFLSRFEIGADEVAQLQSDDEALLRFGFKWLQMALFKRPSLKARHGATLSVKKSAAPHA